MRKIKIFLVGVVIVMAGCGDETPPSLQLDGYWLIDHGFFDNKCQVGATFTDELLVLSFFSTIDGACQPELFGIENNVLVIQIDTQVNYFNDQGALSADLTLSIPERQVTGEVTLTETLDGLSGLITAATDPKGLLEPLMQPNYRLVRASEAWVPLAKGIWATQCSQLEYLQGVSPEEVCEMIEVTDATTGRIKIYSPTAANNGTTPEINSHWEAAIFAMRNIEATRSLEFRLDLVILTSLDGPQFMEAVMNLSDGAMTLSSSVDDETLSINLFPIAPK